MRTYNEAILWIAKSMFHHEMGGGHARDGMSGVYAIAYVYDKHWADVEADIFKKFESLRVMAARDGIDSV